MPASGPRMRRSRRACCRSASSAADELRLLLGQERRVADAEVLGVEAVEALVVLVRRSAARARRAAARTSCASARPAARPRRCAAPSRALRPRPRSSATTRVTRPFSFASAASKMRPSSRISSATAAPTRRTSGAISGVGHHQAEVLDRRAEAARRRRRCAGRTARRSRARRRRRCRGSARPADAGSSASASRGRVHRRAILDRLRLVRALGRELADVVAGRERLLARAAQR